MPSTEDSDTIVLRNPRDVNNEIRQQARQERQLAKQRRKSIGGLRDLADKAVKVHPNDPFAQLNYIGNRCSGIPATIGRARLVSHKRQRDLIEGLGRCIDLSRAAGVRCTNVTDFGRKHFLAVMGEIDAAVDGGDMQESTVKQYISVMKRMTELLGRKDAVPEGQELVRLLQENGISAGTVSREYIAEMAKGWRDQGIDVELVIGAVAADDPLVGVWFELMHHFGLRRREVVCLQPEVSWKGAYMHVFRGTKGNKRRDVPLFADPVRRARQIEVIQKAIAMARTHHKGEMGVPGMDVKQSLERLRTICRKHGITKSALGIVPHGLRHQFGCDLYTDHCGMPAPVLGKLPKAVYDQRVEEHRAALLHVSRALGHERESIVGAYAGTIGRLDKKEKRLRALLEKVQQPGAEYHTAGVAEAWLVGPHAAGAQPRRADVVVVAVRLTDVQIDASRLAQLCAALTRACGLQVHVTPVENRPADGVEIVFLDAP